MLSKFTPLGFWYIIDYSLQYFADTNRGGYGEVLYLTLVDEYVITNCSFVSAKSRVPPTESILIPRSELDSASSSEKASLLSRKELKVYPRFKECFWSDSQIVLDSIRNDATRFKCFVANTV